ncbi:MAG: methylated-DNA--[protein]-cysteine S-methyltransferase [Oscillospiraceae bacterium]|nr:methylated-DNA--[protein]-cysteine S-methyltransferase [Oscillospiraceae bacterium]
MYYKTTYKSPIGIITLASDGENLLGLWNENQKYHGASIPEEMTKEDSLEIFAKAKNWLEQYFEGKQPGIETLPLAPIGSDFRKRVWKALCEIPYGEVTTYGGIAKKIAEDESRAKALSRAIGGAVGHNPISIIIPCHRVIGASGKLTGYAGGLDKKVALLKLEGAL